MDDRINRQPVHQSETLDFQSCIEDIKVGQITKRGNRFSWSNKRDAEDKIYSHIDWAFGNDEWFKSYTDVEAMYMLPGCSDHSLILLDTEVVKTRVNRPYRMLNSVMNHQEYKTAVHTVWNQQIQGCAMYSIWSKLKQVQQATRHIHQEHSSAEKKLQKFREELAETQDKLNEDHFNRQEIHREKQLLQNIEKWEKIQEQVIRQRSRANWIQLGDSNTKYFHAYMKSRQARNKVSYILTENQQKLTDPKQIQQEFMQFFQNLLGTAA
uniref:Uncharacterized protein n=1 Tax=Nicotiana tabacum TaxID=4097 RepID=A0A1S4D0I7_TOBAC|nr:PREDICTED: uncharacterized protein LOC107824548 [Nicotiana tabacum]